MSVDKAINQLIVLARDLCEGGYACGIGGEDKDQWFRAWAVAMQRVAEGEEYTQEMVIGIYHALAKK